MEAVRAMKVISKGRMPRKTKLEEIEEIKSKPLTKKAR
jgi:hypothetical protein